MRDIKKAIRQCVETGRVVFGVKQSIRSAKLGDAHMLIVSSTCPRAFVEDIKYYAKLSNIPVYEFPGTSRELGSASGKPFTISAMAILDPGKSEILSRWRG
ncbi:MAG: 50S ribosomal protein L30e [Methanobacteriota archaeon]|nr:MAG: 50S ribosomal protein L30e [Euryarchaeota archaeon]